MTEQTLKQKLSEATAFAERQKLLKQLWKVQKARESETNLKSSDKMSQPSRTKTEGKRRIAADHPVKQTVA